MLALFSLEVKLAVVAQDIPKTSQASEESQAWEGAFSVIWCNVQSHDFQAVTYGGEQLNPEQRVEESVRAIAKALHTGETVLIFSHEGIHHTGALVILVTHRELLL